MRYEGFPKGVRSIPVPSPIFGPLLEQIDDLDELTIENGPIAIVPGSQKFLSAPPKKKYSEFPDQKLILTNFSKTI